MPVSTPEIRYDLHAALSAIAGVDGDRARSQNKIGFNKVDSDLGHYLADTPPDQWSLRDAMMAWRIAKRYANTQLPLLGIDFSTIPEPEQVPHMRTDSFGKPYGSLLPPVTMKYPDSNITALAANGHQRVAIAWPYGDPDFERKKEMVKAIPGRRWEPEKKYWTAPVTQESIEKVAVLYTEFLAAPSPFQLDEQTANAIDAALVRFVKNVEASYAEQPDEDFEVSSLAPGMTLYPFQVAGVKYMLDNKRVILGDEMGLGKTPQAIAAVAEEASWPVLVVCPASLKLNWKREFERWIGRGAGYNAFLNDGAPADMSSLVISVAQGKKPIMTDQIDVLIINYDLLDAWKDLICSERWVAIIADEAHYLKSHKAQRTKAFKTIVKAVEPDKLFLLTGTPFLSRPIEGWSLIDILGHGSTFGGWMQYTERYCNRRDTGFGMDVSGATNLDELNQKLRSSGILIRRKKTDVLKELPPRRWAEVPIEMTVPEAKAYLKAEQDLARFVSELRSQDEVRLAEWEREAEVAFSANAETAYVGEFVDAYVDAKRRAYQQSEEARLKQSEQLVRFEALKQLAYAGKKKMVMEWIDEFLESGQKLVVFAHHREVVLEIAGRYNAPVIMGGMKTEDVESAKTRFQEDPDCTMIVCNIKAGGVGHTLTAASNVAFVELGWTPADMDQALDRTHRIGQTDSVTGWLLNAQLPSALVVDYASSMAQTIDGEISDLLAKKRAVVERASDGDGVVEQVKVMEELRERLAARTRKVRT